MSFKTKAIFLLVLAAACLLRAWDFTGPFNNGLRGECGACYSTMAENHLRYGIGVTGLANVQNPRPVDPEHLVYYEHHPPVMVALTAAAFAVAGNTAEGSARFFPLLFSISALVILFFWVQRASGPLAAFCALTLAAALPVSTYYGAFLNFETFVLPPVLLSLFFYMGWVGEGRPSSLRWSLAMLALGVLMDWIAVVAGFLMLLDGLIFGRGRNPEGEDRISKKALLLFPLVGVVVFVGVKCWFYLQHSRMGSPSEEGAVQLQYYLHATFLGAHFSWARFFVAIQGHLVSLFTWPVLIAAVLGLILLVASFFRGKARSEESRSLLILVAFGAANILLFASHAERHDYWVFLLYPGLCWCAALAIRWIGSCFSHWEECAPKARYFSSALLLALAVFGALHTLDMIKERQGNEENFRQGLKYADLAEENELILSPEAIPIAWVHYSGGALYHFSIPSPAVLEAERKRMDRYGYGDLRKVFAVPEEKAAQYEAEIRAFEKIVPAQHRKGFLIFPL